MGRGASPRDPVFFHDNQRALLSAATLDLCYLFSRRYAEGAALQLVGNRYQLRERQRLAVLRSAASPAELALRASHRVDDLAGRTLEIDGFNLVILLEAASGGGVILHGPDDCMRDLSSVHGNYRLVSQTAEMIEKIGHWLAAQGIAGARWWFDAPVSNSGRLVTLVRELAATHGWSWEANTDPHVDRRIIQTPDVAVSSDKIILQKCARWTNAGKALVEALAPDAWILPLPDGEDRTHIDAFSALPAQPS